VSRTFRVIESGRIRWAGHVARMVMVIYMCKILVREPEGMRQLDRNRYRRNNIRNLL